MNPKNDDPPNVKVQGCLQSQKKYRDYVEDTLNTPIT